MAFPDSVIIIVRCECGQLMAQLSDGRAVCFMPSCPRFGIGYTPILDMMENNEQPTISKYLQ